MRWLTACIFLLASLPVGSQDPRVPNPSFEDEPRDATVPQGWLPCQPGTTPDILPGYWGVYLPPADGESYVGLITRPNGTWESIGTRMSAPLVPETCYDMAIDLAHSESYAGYAGRIRLRIWAGSLKCLKDQLIWESPVIESTDWKTFPIRFRADGPHRYLLLEAFYSEEEFSFAGNILLDRLTGPRSCEKT